MSTDTVVSAVRESGETGTPLRIAGRGTWLDAGRPVRAQKTLSLRDDSGVVSYVPGDLTITVRAGTPLSEIESVTAEHDQWLPLDPFGPADGTIGATISTASAGPLASSFGSPRELLLGLEFVTGRGDVVRGGGKVVKNVAGFDLSRLLTGSWGTLGVITEVTLRLYARPEIDRSFVVVLANAARESTEFIHGFLTAPFTPYAFELLSPRAALALGLGTNPVCLVRFGGNEAAVEMQLKVLSQFTRVEEVETRKWEELRMLERGSECVIRVSGLPAQFRAASGTILNDPQSNFYTYIDPVRGVLRLVARPSSDGALVDGQELGLSADSPQDIVAFETLPAEVWPDVSPSVVSDGLSQGIKRAYDPRKILNPGILGD